MRADAARRRAAVLREARRLFAEAGDDVALELIADAAGVGIATLYRNFGSRAELAEAVGLEILGDLRAATARAAAGLPADPEGAWRAFVTDLVALELGALTPALHAHLDGAIGDPLRDGQDAVMSAVDDLLLAVRAAGLVPDDLTALELVVALGIVTRPPSEALRRAAPHLVDRLVETLLAGLRARA